MARLVLRSIEAGEHTTLADLRRVTGEQDFMPQTPEDIVSRLLHTVSLATDRQVFSLLTNPCSVTKAPSTLPKKLGLGRSGLVSYLPPLIALFSYKQY